MTKNNEFQWEMSDEEEEQLIRESMMLETYKSNMCKAKEVKENAKEQNIPIQKPSPDKEEKTNNPDVK